MLGRIVWQSCPSYETLLELVGRTVVVAKTVEVPVGVEGVAVGVFAFVVFCSLKMSLCTVSVKICTQARTRTSSLCAHLQSSHKI